MPGSEYSSVELQRMLMTDSGMAAAAQQLMQLSDEDNSSISSSNGNKNDKKIRAKDDERERFFKHNQYEMT
ncbi:hypothetical protein Gohar_023060 [Gossypium harknessii]|uniref:Uncharacterized protein n=3 Tax=Gossypium TaxID=3633 RepID=A0A7J8Q084_GOSRA|nr:hypothetical protein [Gossypium raimondii]MBA0719794.1 hypothetical protein [Gossypium laxum]MBA0807242.1 hypothetical protein [Gossypium harknessii]